MTRTAWILLISTLLASTASSAPQSENNKAASEPLSVRADTSPPETPSKPEPILPLTDPQLIEATPLPPPIEPLPAPAINPPANASIKPNASNEVESIAPPAGVKPNGPISNDATASGEKVQPQMSSGSGTSVMQPMTPGVNVPIETPSQGFAVDTPFHPQPATCDCIGSCDGNCSSGTRQSVANHWSPWRRLRQRFRQADLDRFMLGKRFRRRRTHDRGIGYERVMYAPTVLDTAITVPHYGIRYQIDSGLNRPDRAEYFWASDSAGPGHDPNVNVQDVHFRLALGNERVMAITEYTMRSLDPELAGNTTGMGDIVIGAQGLVVDGKRTKVATIFRTHIAKGNTSRGLGTGNTAIEPGILIRHCRSPETYWFGELKYWVPLKGNADTSGEVLTTGLGVSTIAAESDVFAFIPTLEVRLLSFLSGGETIANPSTIGRVDGKTAVEIYPGARFVLGPESDIGLWELGFAGGVTAGDGNWFDSRFVIDLRLSH